MRDKKLLVLAHHYRVFIKDQVEALSPYFSEIFVIVRYNPIFAFGGRFFKFLNQYQKMNLLDEVNKPKNVHLFLSPVYYLPINFFYRRLGDKHFKSVLDCINKNKIDFDLIHAHFTSSSGYAGVKLAQKYDVPVVITIHENRDWLLQEYSSNDERIYWAWKNADALIRVNQIDIPLLREYNENVFYVPNGFNPNKFFIMEQSKAREILKLSVDRKIIFTFSNLIKRKGFQYLINSMNEIIKKRKDVLCFIGGSGPMRGKLEAQINNLGLKDHVKLLGFVSDDHLSFWLNVADLFVLPSLSEGNPTVMFEALGVGLPFVGTAVGGVPEVITSEDYGLLVKEASHEDLTEKILIALENKWDNDKIMKYARQFTWDNIAKQIFDLYNLIEDYD